MKLSLPIIATSLLLFNNVESKWVPSPGTTWNNLLDTDDSEILTVSETAVTIDIDKSEDLISKLHNKGKKVICHFSGGILEKYRDDADKYKAVRDLVHSGENEGDEEWLDYRMSEIKPLIKFRIMKAHHKNCDAIEVDDLGAYEYSSVQSWSNPITKEDAYNYAKWLSSTAHEIDISIGIKNVADIAPRLVDNFDFAIVERCSRLDICEKYKDFPKHDKAVFTIHYGNTGDGSFNDQRSRIVEELKGYGYSCLFNNDDKLKHPGFSFNCEDGSTNIILSHDNSTSIVGNNGFNTTDAMAQNNNAKADGQNEILDNQKISNGSNTGTTIAIIAIGGAAVACTTFFLLKKSKKLSKDFDNDHEDNKASYRVDNNYNSNNYIINKYNSNNYNGTNYNKNNYNNFNYNYNFDYDYNYDYNYKNGYTYNY